MLSNFSNFKSKILLRSRNFMCFFFLLLLLFFVLFCFQVIWQLLRQLVDRIWYNRYQILFLVLVNQTCTKTFSEYLQFCPYTGKYVSEKSRILAYFMHEHFWKWSYISSQRKVFRESWKLSSANFWPKPNKQNLGYLKMLNLELFRNSVAFYLY